MKQEDAYRATPQQAGKGPGERLSEQRAERKRYRETHEQPGEERAVDKPRDGVGEQVLGVTVGRCCRVPLEDPADVSMDEAVHRAAYPGAMVVRAVGIAGLVGE